MSRHKLQPTTEGVLVAAEKHNRVLLHALQTAHPVMCEGRARFIHTITYQVLGGGVDATIYLTGGDTAFKPLDIQLQEHPQ